MFLLLTNRELKRREKQREKEAKKAEKAAAAPPAAKSAVKATSAVAEDDLSPNVSCYNYLFSIPRSYPTILVLLYFYIISSYTH